MADIESPVEIQARMAQLRRGIRYQVRSGVHDAKDWFDWKQLIARHPIASIGLATAIGFALVPRRHRKELPVQAATNGHVRSEETLGTKTQPARIGVAGSLLRSVISAGVSIAVNRIIRSMAERAANPEIREHESRTHQQHSMKRTTKE